MPEGERGLDLDEAGAVVAAAGGDDAACELAVLDRPDEVLSGFGPDRDCRQGRHRCTRRQSDAAGHEHAAAQRAVGVGHMDEHQNGSRARFRGRIDAIDRAGEAAFTEAVDRERDLHAEAELRNIVGRDHRLELHLRQVHDGHERSVEGHFLAGLDVPLGDDA